MGEPIRVRMLHPEGRCSWAGFKLENGALGWTTMERIHGTPNVWVRWDAQNTRAGIQPEYLEVVSMKADTFTWDGLVFIRRPNGNLEVSNQGGGEMASSDEGASSLLAFLDPERENDLQRARREGYAEALRQNTTGSTKENREVRAAQRYPLKVTRPAKSSVQGMEATAHLDGSVTVNGVGTFQRSTLRELLALSENPLETVESTEVER